MNFDDAKQQMSKRMPRYSVLLPLRAAAFQAGKVVSRPEETGRAVMERTLCQLQDRFEEERAPKLPVEAIEEGAGTAKPHADRSRKRPINRKLKLLKTPKIRNYHPIHD
jgi:hypothetical protein